MLKIDFTFLQSVLVQLFLNYLVLLLISYTF
nr:MAG TPA: hypothetical protein [Caudoviricetes sp.]